jgi:hypothetical protein
MDLLRRQKKDAKQIEYLSKTLKGMVEALDILLSKRVEGPYRNYGQKKIEIETIKAALRKHIAEIMEELRLEKQAEGRLSQYINNLKEAERQLILCGANPSVPYDHYLEPVKTHLSRSHIIVDEVKKEMETILKSLKKADGHRFLF